jgi:hypothetical protein
MYFVPLLGQHTNYEVWFLVYLLNLCKFFAELIALAFAFLMAHPWKKTSFKVLNDSRHAPCSSIQRHRNLHIEHTYWMLTTPVCTRLRDWIWGTERGFYITENGLQLPASTGSFPASSSHSILILPHVTYCLVLGHGKQVWITWLHCTGQVIRTCSWSGQCSAGGGRACQCALYKGGQASGGCWQYTEYVNRSWILSEHCVTRVQNWLPWYWQHWEFFIGCDLTRGVACQQEHNLQVDSLDTCTKNRHPTPDDVGLNTLGNLQAMLVKPVSNAWRSYLLREHYNTH